MFCPHCGAQVEDGAQFCGSCGGKIGNSVDNIVDGVKDGLNKAEGQLESAVVDMKSTFDNMGSNNSGNNYNGNNYNSGNYNSGNNYNGGSAPGEKLQCDRSLVSYILLSIITCGIYSYYFVYKMAHDVNIACEGDGEQTSGLVAFILLSFITCGIYSFIWEYKLGNRLATNAPRYGYAFQENGTTVLMWCLFGALLCGIGPFIAMNILIKNSNMICMAYNRQHGYI